MKIVQIRVSKDISKRLDCLLKQKGYEIKKMSSREKFGALLKLSKG